MKTKTPLIVAISSGLTLAIVLSSASLLLLLRDRNPEPESNTSPTANLTPVAQPLNPAQPVNPGQPSPPVTITRTQAENDYLYDLSQALLPQERSRTSEAEKLEIGQKIRGWLAGGADYWGVRQKFDETYKGIVLDNYAHNRDVYIKFATERFAVEHLDTLTPPPQVIREVVRVPVRESGSSGSSGSSGNSQPDPGNPIPEQEALVIESGWLNCRATPNGTVVGKLYTGQTVKVNRVAYGTGKAWYLTTQGCWAFGGGLKLASSPTPGPTPGPTPSPTPSPIPEQDALVKAKGWLNCRATPNGRVVDKFPENSTIRVTQVDHSTGKPWYLTNTGCWVAGDYIQL
ncbi:MAG: hypothetical protein ACKO7W_23670 [Elainella sp.]